MESDVVGVLSHEGAVVVGTEDGKLVWFDKDGKKTVEALGSKISRLISHEGKAVAGTIEGRLVWFEKNGQRTHALTVVYNITSLL